MRQSFSGNFPVDQQGVTVADTALSNAVSGYSAGSCVLTTGSYVAVDPQLPGPAPNQHWSLLGFSVHASLGFFIRVYATANPTVSIVTQPFGDLRRIRAFVIPGDSAQNIPATASSTSPPTSNYQPLPGGAGLQFDSSLAVDLWNPDVDDVPPQLAVGYSSVMGITSSYQSGLIPIQCGLNPPFPIRLQPNQPPILGIQMFPSILGFGNITAGKIQEIGLFVSAATYIIDYDDGL